MGATDRRHDFRIPFPSAFPDSSPPSPAWKHCYRATWNVPLAEEVLEVDAAWGRGMDDVSRRLGRR